MPDERPRALLLAPEAPYPLAGGGALRTASLLHYLALHYDLDLIVFREPGAPDPRVALPPGLARRLTAIDLLPNGRTLAARVLRNASRTVRRIPPLVDRFAGFGDAIARAVEGAHYQIGIIEHFWCAPYLPRIAGVCRRTVLDLHNVESVLHSRSASVAPGPVAFGHRVFGRASERLEREWLPRFSSVLVTSERDAEQVRAIAPQAKPRVYPNAIPLTPLPPPSPDEAIVFSGNMEYHPNLTAVRHFRAKVWPTLRARFPGLVWRLVGKNPEAIRGYVAGDPRIHVTGAVENAVAEIARSKIAIVPLLSGSGTRLKILEAWAAGVPVVSTTIGAEGLPVRDGEHLLIADGPAAFAGAVTRLLECTVLRQTVSAAGRLLMEKEFTWETAWTKLDF